MSKKTISGGCQCGAVRYHIAADSLVSYACHCRECQKQSSSAFGISVPVLLADIEIEGETKSWRRPTDSGSRTRCYFCTKCGSRLYHAGDNRPGVITVKGGSLDCAADLQPVAHLWTDSKQGWVELPVGVPQYAKQPESQQEWWRMLGGQVEH